MSNAPDAAVSETASRTTPIKGIGVLALIILVVGGFLALMHFVGNAAGYAGFLFLLYWAGIEHAKLEKLPAIAIGAFAGLGLAYLLHAAPAAYGAIGIAAAAFLLLLAIYCQVMGWFALVINMATMLFLTVATIPFVQKQADFTEMAMAVVLAVLYFGGLAFTAAKLKRPAAQATPSVAAE